VQFCVISALLHAFPLSQGVALPFTVLLFHDKRQSENEVGLG